MQRGRNVEPENIHCSQCRQHLEVSSKVWPDCRDCDTIRYLVESIQAYLGAETGEEMEIAMRMSKDSMEQAAFGMLD